MTLLLTSVFGPYGVDDEYGEKENKMELFHNQVTREQQGLFIPIQSRKPGALFPG
jgi:hypothetical protein